MDSFVLDPTFNVVICTRCQQGICIKYRSLQQHLSQGNHSGVSIVEVQRRFQHANPLAPSEVPLPHYPIPPIPHLRTVTDCVACTVEGCHLNFRTTRALNNHHTSHHRELKQRAPRRTITCQQVTHKGRGSRLFEVLQTSSSHDLPLHPPSQHERRPCDDFHEEQARVQETLSRIVTDEASHTVELEKYDTNRWLRRTRWAELLRRYNLPYLSKLYSTPPSQQLEQQLSYLCEKLDLLLRASQHIATRCVRSNVLFAVNRKEGNGPSRRPFAAWMEESTREKYLLNWRRLICFIFRCKSNCFPSTTGANPDGEDDPATAGHQDLPKFHETAQQRDSFNRLEVELKKAIRRKNYDNDNHDYSIPHNLFNDSNDNDLDDNSTTDSNDAYDNNESDDDTLDDDKYDNDGYDKNTNRLNTFRTDRTAKALLDWILTLFNQRLNNRLVGHSEAPVLFTLAVAGIRSSDFAWLSPLDYTPKLAAISKGLRFFVIAHAWLLDEKVRTPVLDTVEQIVKESLTRDQPTPMQWILDLLRYGLKVRHDTTSDGVVSWIRDRLNYKGMEFTMSQFREMAHGLVNRARQTLDDDVLMIGTTGLPDIPWDRLRDDPANSTNGWNFTKHEANNRTYAHGAWWLFHRIWHEPALRARFVTTDERSTERYQMASIQTWRESVSRFKEYLLALMQITGGQPARAPELLSIRHSNTRNARRNIFIEQGSVLFVTDYHKGYSLTGTLKIIHRYLPRPVGALLVHYISLVIPFEQQLAATLEPDLRRLNQFLWPTSAEPGTKGWSSERFSAILRNTTEFGLGTSLSIAGYRQVAIAIGRKYLAKDATFERDDDDDLEDQEDADEAWYDKNDDPLDLQAGHSSYTAGMIYARGIEELPGETSTLKQQFLRVSYRWHGFLNFQPVSRAPKRGIDEDAVEQKIRDARVRRLHEMVNVRPATILQAVMGPTAAFRRGQEEAIQTLFAGHPRVLCVMATGAGKSLIYMLPAAWSGAGTTVVVVPLVSLKADLARRCLEANILCVEWNAARMPHSDVRIVIITPESVITNTFGEYLFRLRRSGRLDRIVVDECHTILDSAWAWRPKALELKKHLATSPQTLLLTATLPPTLEAEVLKRYGFSGVKVEINRMPTVRANVQYSVIPYQGDLERCVALIQRCQAIVKSRYTHGKVLVYAQTVKAVTTLCKLVGEDTLAFYAGLPSGVKQEAAREMIDRPYVTVVATSALGMGIDIPDVRFVIHVDAPDSLIAYGQESGRAGRDGEDAAAILLHGGFDVKEGLRRDDGRGRRRGSPNIAHFCSTAVCRRAVLDGYLDGHVGREGCHPARNEILCDNCAAVSKSDVAHQFLMPADILQAVGGTGGTATSTTTTRTTTTVTVSPPSSSHMSTPSPASPYRSGAGLPEITITETSTTQRTTTIQRAQAIAAERDADLLSKRYRQTVSNDAAARDRLLPLVAEWAGKCAMCYAAGCDEDVYTAHTLHRCTTTSRFKKAQTLAPTISKIFKAEKYCACYNCGLPQHICSSWQPSGNGFKKVPGGFTCSNYRYVVLDVAVCALVCPPRDSVGLPDPDDVATTAQWLGKKSGWAGFRYTTNAVEVFYRFAYKYSRVVG